MAVPKVRNKGLLHTSNGNVAVPVIFSYITEDICPDEMFPVKKSVNKYGLADVHGNIILFLPLLSHIILQRQDTAF